MSDERLERHIRQYIEAQTGDEAVASGQGGEPTIQGLGFFEIAVAAARLPQSQGVAFNALCVVNRENAKFPLDVYRFLTRGLGAKRIQLIARVEPKVFRDLAPQRWDPAQLPVVGTPRARPGTPDSIVTDWSVDPQDWGAFLCKVWDDWVARDLGKVFVDLFETAVAQSMGPPSQRCITAEFCGKALAVEHDGEVFSCDHYVYPGYRLGNLHETHWAEAGLNYLRPAPQAPARAHPARPAAGSASCAGGPEGAAPKAMSASAQTNGRNGSTGSAFQRSAARIDPITCA
jgi:sulfatase maturation enzyme AslB (radical SAM superfamily)